MIQRHPKALSNFDNIISNALTVWLFLAFTDQVIRKFSPTNSIEITMAKDFILVTILILLVKNHSRWLNEPFKILGLWFLYTLISTIVISLESNAIFLLACLRTYIILPIAGLLIGMWFHSNPNNLIAKWKKWKFLVYIACLLAIMQNYVPYLLPLQFLKHISREQHGLSNALYTESLFASPVVFGFVLFLTFIGFVSQAKQEKSLKKLLSFALPIAIILFCVYLCRVRTFLIFCFLFLIFSFGKRAFKKNPTIMLLIIWTFIIGFFTFEKLQEHISDKKYYANAFQADQISNRFQTFFLEFSWRNYTPTLFGEGSGTSGMIRDLVPGEFANLPRTTDSGFFLLITEFGILGFLVFFIPIVFLLIKRKRNNQYKNNVFYNIAYITFVFQFGLFIFKVHGLIENGLMSLLFFSNLGFLLRKDAVTKVVIIQNPSLKSIN